MNKNITIAFFILTTLLSIAYGFSQKIRAEQYRELADKQSLLEEKLMEQLRIQKAMADQQRILAERNMQEVLVQRALANK
jgi:hypothetical protein